MTGDANFHMEKTALTVGGFTQPSVARNLLDQQASIEKGLPQRFLWLVPQPYFSTFDSLEPIDNTFYNSLGKLSNVSLTVLHPSIQYTGISNYCMGPMGL